ncbi:MAG: hypothetical protein ACLUMK_05090 [Christensenellales bacterium]
MARLCMQYDVRVCVDSDAHFCANVGRCPRRWRCWIRSTSRRS